MKKTQWASFLVIICMLITMVPKVDFADEVTVESVRAKLEEIDTLQEMQATRELQFNVSDSYSETTANEHKTMKEGYEKYLTEMFKARAEAAEGYAALSAEDKQLIASELVEKLDNNLDTVWHNISYNVSPGVDDYQFQAVYPGYSYELSNHMVSRDGGKNKEIPQTLMLVDTAKNSGTWTPNGKYSFGTSNYEVVYCSDTEYVYKDGAHYQRINLEDSTYYDAEAAEHIRAIVSNSYPYLSLEQMKANLAQANFAYAEQLTRSDIIAAVQVAIWNYSNGAEANGAQFTYSNTFDLNTNTKWGKGIHDYTNELWDWWSVGYRKLTVNNEAGDRINALAKYLAELEGEKAHTNQIVINEVKIEGAEPVQAKEGAYNVALKVLLNNGGTSGEDNIKITVKTNSQAITQEVKLGKAEYDIVIEAKAGETIHVLVEGNQTLPKGVYLYMPSSREVSQVLVGVAEGLTAIQATDSVTLDIPEIKPVTANLNVQKTDEKGVELTGATFDLYFHGKEATYNIGTYPVDKNGGLIIENLLPGNYELVESIVPEGYVNPEKPIGFSIDEDGVMTLAASANAELVNGIVIVKNYPTPITPLGSLSIKKVNSISKEALEGAAFTLKGKDFEKTLTTGKDGTLLFSDLAYGEYTLIETAAPAGYVKDATEWPIKIGIGEGAQLEWVQEVANTPVGSLEITKIDTDSSKTLEGAEFTLTNQEGNVVGTLTTDESGKATFKNLPYGNYKLEETKAPEGYLLSKEATNTFTISEPGQKVELTYKNTRENSRLSVEKTADKNEATVGETVTYSIVVTNTDDKALTNVLVKDEMIGLDTVIDQLDVNESKTFTGEYVVTADDIGELENIATATVEIDGEQITHDASVSVKVSAVEAAVDQNPQTGDTTINILLALFVFVLAGSGLYIYRRKNRA